MAEQCASQRRRFVDPAPARVAELRVDDPERLLSGIVPDLDSATDPDGGPGRYLINPELHVSPDEWAGALPLAPAACVVGLDCLFGEGSEHCGLFPATIGIEAVAEMSGEPPAPHGRSKREPVGPIGELIAEAMRAHDYSLGDAARAIRQAGLARGAKDATCSASTIFKWVHNGVIPYPRYRQWISAGLGIPRDRLDEAIEGQESMANNESRITRTLDGLGLSPDDIPDLEDIEAAVARLRRSYSTTPPNELRRRVDERIRQIRRLLGQNDRPAWRSSLIEAASWLVLLRATTLADLRSYEAAQTAVHAARDLAREIGHRDLEAWTWETAAWMATTDGRHCDAHDLASAGVEVAPVGSHGLVAVTMQRARINATIGEESAAIDDLLRGERALSRAPNVEYPDDHYLIDPAKSAFFISGTMAALHRPKETIEHAAEVVRASESKRTRNYWPMRVANARVEWAMALTDLGQEDEAFEQAKRALEPEWFRPDTERRMRALLDRMRDPRLRSDLAGELAERLRDDGT